MAAPTTAACVKKTLANPEPSTHEGLLLSDDELRHCGAARSFRGPIIPIHHAPIIAGKPQRRTWIWIAHRIATTETAALQAKVLTDDEARRVAHRAVAGFVGATRLTARRRRAQVARAGADTRARAVATSTTSEPWSGARDGP
jgi:hypothetical protein